MTIKSPTRSLRVEGNFRKKTPLHERMFSFWDFMTKDNLTYLKCNFSDHASVRARCQKLRKIIFLSETIGDYLAAV